MFPIVAEYLEVYQKRISLYIKGYNKIKKTLIMKKTSISFLLMLSTLFANDDLLLEDDFLQSLEEVSEIATKTKLNIDDTPSFVTVLHSQKLKKLGIVNVFEALGLVPGVQLKKEKSGVPVVVFRGVTQKGEVKLMIDGVTINNAYRGSIYYYLDFPIEMIKRIEVIRGAGSILYGSNAMSGVINIITNNSQKDSKNRVFVAAGSYSSKKVGTLISTNINDIRISIDAYNQQNDKSIFVESNPSGLSGDSDRHLKDYSAGITISNEQFSLLARIKKSDIGNAYGILSGFDDEKNKFYNKNKSILTQLSYNNNLNTENKLSAFIGYNEYSQIAEGKHPTAPVIIDSDYKEKTYFSELNLLSTSFKDNKLLIGMKYEYNKELKNGWLVNSNPSANPIVSSNFSRKITSIYLNDNYSLLSNLELSAGIRYDHYSDFGDAYSPNLGLVYRLNEEIRFKALYSHAFRAPSWVELTSNPNLEAEKSNSIEAGVIFKQNQQNTLRLNFYTSKIEDMITKPASTYIQNSHNHFLGSELEYIYLANNQTEINFLASYVKAEDENGNDLTDVANILASASLTYELDSGITFGSLLKYVSSSNRSSNDTRDQIAQSFIFDQTISYTYKDFTTSLVLKDLFDAGTYYALPQNSYAKDFDDGGRTIMLNASLEF